MGLHVINHPLVQHKLGILREEGLATKDFRQLVKEVGSLLTFSATTHLELTSKKISTWQGDLLVPHLAGLELTVVPILRAGLGMTEGVLEILPNAPVSVIGLYRNEETLEPVSYFERIVKDIAHREALVVDPMLATGGSMIAAIDLLKKHGCKKIKAIVLVAAPEGVQAMEKAHPDVEIFTASLDERLNNHGYIIPGLGDAGDRIFGTPV